MPQMRIVKPSCIQWLVTENLVWWNVITRTVPGQEYCWVVINSDKPMIGPAPPLVSGHWVSDWGVSNRRMHWNLTLDMRKAIFSIHENARKIIDTLISTYNLKCTFPPVLSLHWLEDQFYTEETLAAKVAEARYHILEQYGFIVFQIKKHPDWITRLDLSTVKDLIISADVKKLHFKELWMLIEHQVPMHYQWFPTDTGPFDPKVLKASDYNELRRPSHKSSHQRNIKSLPCRLWERLLSIDTDCEGSHPRAPSPPGEEQVMLQESGSSRKRTLSASTSSAPEAKRYCGVTSNQRPAQHKQLTSEPPVLLQDCPLLDVGVSPSSAPQVLDDTAPIPQPLSQLPPVFITGVTFPAVPAQRTGQLITTFRSAICIAYDMSVNPSASPADSIPGLLRSGAPYQIRVPFASENVTPESLDP
ncbi:hypothetical protein DEU56DRAFT_759408 [Suillus clintonianus]|uniref:uncharacterized protein n=1 Tax=Suillus clintonianus TaxID=1904413 RepID=UPI001B871EBD|nr:uncharacterized protein DEU56DRAFT_759408 [Suillus clintonianus]KAG2125166.1 hypothetical protein DEU56DRAFT_759408 [Suillus clintonianus]